MKTENESINKEWPSTPKKPEKGLRVIEINSGIKSTPTNKFKNSLLYEKLNGENLTESLVKSFNRESGKIKTEEIEKSIKEYAKEKKKETETLINEQAKIFNKILWIKILTERILEDNKPQELKFDSQKSKAKQNKISKMTQEVYKTSNYLGIVEK